MFRPGLERLPVVVAQAQGTAVQRTGILVEEFQGALRSAQSRPWRILGAHHQEGVPVGQQHHRIAAQRQALEDAGQQHAAAVQVVRQVER